MRSGRGGGTVEGRGREGVRMERRSRGRGRGKNWGIRKRGRKEEQGEEKG